MSEDTTPSNTRTHILCFDGTASEYDLENTNVVKFFALLEKDDCDDQLCYYQVSMLGTFFAPGVVSPLFQWCAKVLDEAFAWYLDAHVMDGYRFLMQNFRTGDKICLFGFSRGAYTARALAGMLYKVGLLPRGNQEQIVFAYKLYTRTDDAGIELSAGFKKTYCQPVEIEFLGVWDTVASVGVIATKTLPFTSNNSSIKTFRQGIPCLYHRARFKPNLFHREPPNSSGSAEVEGIKVEIGPRPLTDPGSETAPSPMSRTLSDYFRRKKQIFEFDIPKIASRMDEQTTRETDVLEVWFAGCHSDIGGGSVSNSTKQCLSNISLRWMVRQVMESQCGIKFNENASMQLEIHFEPIQVSWKSLDTLDSLQPLHDALVQNPAWWLLEILPMKTRYQDADCRWHTTYAWNLGRGRQIYTPKPYFHMTVKYRYDDVTLAYKPKARWQEGTEVYIE
ncbi:hypothetical protein F5876DRAFT_50024 [Lentinula aff. lateritia]|uniref:Uncharacterized protein n=1 Tax=Lentinula aff. lateritia TaxID=2804960 RepID=A0ACC1TPH9_9AGAR|nr:hypothetical protein F5876DRAFT_50024 [Lentinula aff. lateritia]